MSALKIVKFNFKNTPQAEQAVAKWVQSREMAPVPHSSSSVSGPVKQNFKYTTNLLPCLVPGAHIAPKNLNMGYAWVERLMVDYFPLFFTTLNFSKKNAAIFGVKPQYIAFFCSFLKNSSFFRCTSLLDIYATDFPSRENRFEVTYVLLSMTKNTRIYIRTYVGERGILPSLVPVFPSANWLEREIWDMLGVPFQGHPDLRRILTDYGFFGHPLRKDFPLTGFFEIRYDDSTRRVVSEALNLIQELRLFFFTTPWNSL